MAIPNLAERGKVSADALGAARMATCHLGLNESDDGCENCTGNTTAHRLADQGADVSRTCSTRERRNQCRKKLTTGHTADRARDRVAHWAKI